MDRYFIKTFIVKHNFNVVLISRNLLNIIFVNLWNFEFSKKIKKHKNWPFLKKIIIQNTPCAPSFYSKQLPKKVLSCKARLNLDVLFETAKTCYSFTKKYDDGALVKNEHFLMKKVQFTKFNIYLSHYTNQLNFRTPIYNWKYILYILILPKLNLEFSFTYHLNCCAWVHLLAFHN